MDDQTLHPVPPPFPGVQAQQPAPTPFPSAANAPQPGGLPSRDEVRALRMKERAGVPFHLKRPPACTVTVRALSFAERTFLAGVPAELQQTLTAAFNRQTAARGGAARTFAEIMQAAGSDEDIANVLCVAGFVSPPLVMAEADLAGKPGAWVVDDVHIDDRRRYMRMVLGTGDAEDLEEIARFLVAPVAG